MRNHNNKELRTCFKENFNNTWQQHWKLKIKNILNLLMHHQVELIERNRKRKEKVHLTWMCSS